MLSEKIISRSIDPATNEMLARAEELGFTTAWDRYEAMLPQCGFGELGVCCRNCNMGPCRISPFEDEGPQLGICGATADIIVARSEIGPVQQVGHLRVELRQIDIQLIVVPRIEATRGGRNIGGPGPATYVHIPLWINIQGIGVVRVGASYEGTKKY